MAKKVEKSKSELAQEILNKFDKELSTLIAQDIKEFFKNFAIDVKGSILKEPTIQINLSKDYDKLIIIFRETSDINLEKTFFEIDFMEQKFPKNSKSDKLIQKIKKEFKKLN